MEHLTTQEEIRLELTELKAEVKQLGLNQAEMRMTLQEVRDRVIGAVVCPSPGLCVLLRQQGDDREARIRALERRDVFVLGACAAISVLGPILMKYLFKI